MTAAAKNWEADPLLDSDHRGPLPRVHVSLKLTALDPRSMQSLLNKVQRESKHVFVLSFVKAQEVQRGITVDMEQYRYKDLTYESSKKFWRKEEFRSWPHVGIVLQAYLRDTEQDLYDLLTWARRRTAPIGRAARAWGLLGLRNSDCAPSRLASPRFYA